jgi:hypothetical protein
MHGWMHGYGWVDAWVLDGWMDAWVWMDGYGWMGRCMDGWMDAWVWMDACMDGRGFEISGVAIVQTCSQLLKLYQTYWYCSETR